MTLSSLRDICLALPDASEDVKWGQDLVFSVGKRMFCVVNAEPPHQLAFKCTPEEFSELVERDGVRPAPYLARAMWVQEETLGTTFERPELERLIRQSYELVRAKLPKRTTKRKKKKARSSAARVSGARRSRGGPARPRRRGR